MKSNGYNNDGRVTPPSTTNAYRRSRSAPPPSNKKRSMIEDHYPVYKESDKMILGSGNIIHNKDWHRDIHDFFNLIVLLPVIILNAINWNWELLRNYSTWTINTLEDAWVGEYSSMFYRFVVTYFFVDLFYVLLIPHCVKSPNTILIHHVLCLVYTLVPVFMPEFMYLMGLNMSVEANTWFLIARRVFNKQGLTPWTLTFQRHSIQIKVISICFYITWIVIRILLYPAIGFKLYGCYGKARALKRESKACYIIAFAVVFQILLCVLNLKWTRDLIIAKIRFWKRKDKSDGGISKGL